MNEKEIIYVTKPDLPPFEDFLPLLKDIWDSKVLTNCGPYHQKLEAALCEYLGVEYISLFCNATIALVTALQALRVTGEVITTPYSFVATSHSLVWNGLKPVFVDVDPVSFNIDPSKIEAAITPETTAIMAVHCYGTPCDVDAIQKIADAYDLKVIYDAAHAFGVKDERGSVLNHGDMSVLSFHATKVFNTFEGGAIICKDAKTKRRIDNLKNFGILDETTVVAPGINGKMSEFNAALGLLQLQCVDAAIARRKLVAERYVDLLSSVQGIKIPDTGSQYSRNYSYFPVLIEDGFPQSRDEVYALLRKHGIYARRYFYPLISDFSIYRNSVMNDAHALDVSKNVADSVLCLPIYPDLGHEVVDKIVRLMCGG
ncbi:DegT/DnrJ/EryC1/StrS family aminotransferase [Burkholderiaceae bacterium DAT-1]|nr:DegT/DnrJ/EryC1/StrS family aminotransferase [Burkholderiaceae bacterium DAT-1]